MHNTNISDATLLSGFRNKVEPSNLSCSTVFDHLCDKTATANPIPRYSMRIYIRKRQRHCQKKAWRPQNASRQGKELDEYNGICGEVASSG